jgi:transcription-repair coupling factor (superfamily II helicase)
VGRYKYQAYAYFMIPKDRPILPEARRRLDAIARFSELGAGFKIAMKDLEIRGAGNLLGKEQHGHITAVGYELYVRLLEDAIKRLKNQETEERIEVEINLPVSYYIPSDYIEDIPTRLGVYKKIASADTPSRLREIKEELRDRFGRLPQGVENLLELAHLKLALSRYKISSLWDTKDAVLVRFTTLKDLKRITKKKNIKLLDGFTLQISKSALGKDLVKGLLRIFREKE